MISFKIIFLTFLNLIRVSESKWIEGILKTDSDWDFLTRFCFLTQEGTISYDFQYPVDLAPQELLLYYDTPGQWDAVYKSGKNCSESKSVLREQNNQVIRLTQETVSAAVYSGCVSRERGGKPWYFCSGKRGFRSSRERWWYVAISRCAKNNPQLPGLYLEYKIHMTNGQDLLHREYSADEFYILPVDIVFFLLYIIISLLSVICAVVLRGRQLFHTTYKLYLTSVCFWLFHLFLMVIAWGYYGSTGWEAKKLEVVGRILRATSQVIFILMLILMAKGYTITRGRLTRISSIKITVFIHIYIVVIVILFIWEGLLFDPGLVLYYYESPPGYGMVTIQLIGWLWFLYATVFTLKHFPSHHKFYIPFFSFFTLWFWASPIMVLTAMFAMAKWSREKTVNGVEQFIGFCGHIFFLILTRPNAANENFPYHIRTSQIGFTDSADDSSKLKNPYAVSSGVAFSGSGPNLEFFITTRTAERQMSAVAGGEGCTVALENNVTVTFNKQTLSYHPDGENMGFSAADSSMGPGDRPNTVINSNINNNYNHNVEPLASPLDMIPPHKEYELPPIRRVLLPPLVPTAPLYTNLVLTNGKNI